MFEYEVLTLASDCAGGKNSQKGYTGGARAGVPEQLATEIWAAIFPQPARPRPAATATAGAAAAFASPGGRPAAAGSACACNLPLD